MANIIAVVNQKGGVGKTTTCVNLAYSLGLFNVKTLLLDFDPQGNATSGYGVAKRDTLNIYDVIMNGADIRQTIVSTPYGDIVPSNTALAGAGVEIVDMEGREFLLKKALEPIWEDYEAIIIDCPPSLELLTVNALCAADKVLIPIQCEYYALEGLTDLLNTIQILNQKLNPQLKIMGMLMTMFDGRTQLSNQVVREVRAHFPELVYPINIPRNVRLAEAPSHGKPVQAMDKYSKGARAYRKLAKRLSSELKEEERLRREALRLLAEAEQPETEPEEISEDTAGAAEAPEETAAVETTAEIAEPIQSEAHETVPAEQEAESRPQEDVQEAETAQHQCD